ncbi:MAG: helix-turn-helix transcriptional regulator [Clostridia bacterium]|nr:helix-turn-helix transcriptional regulator [Clostridia bacterium]
MNKKEFSPYIRVAMFSTLIAPFKIEKRVIFDYELILVSDGKCKITIDDTEYLCKKNDVVFLRPDIPHKFECIDNCDFVQPHIHFDVSYNKKSEKRFVSFKPKEAMSDYELTLIQEDVFKDIYIPYVFSPSDMEKFQKIFFEIIELFQKKAYNYELLYKSKMLELFDCILTQFDSDKTIKIDMTYNPVIAVKNYIDSNYLSVITLDSLSKQFYFNKYTLIRKFKAMYNQNLMSYYRNKRIEYIKNMLRTTNLSITVLSEKLNFSDIYSFSRFFKTYVGCSPTFYRKNHFVN